MNRLIIFLIRKKLGLKKYEDFQFENQHNKKNTYFFTDSKLFKKVYYPELDYRYRKLSNVSLNWLLSNKCKIIKVDKEILEENQMPNDYDFEVGM